MKLGVVVLLLLALSSAPRPITLSVSPRVSLTAPATLALRVRVHPIATDQYLTVQMDDGAFRRESTWQPDPDSDSESLIVGVLSVAPKSRWCNMFRNGIGASQFF